MEVSLVIPTYQDRHRIAGTVRGAWEYLSGLCGYGFEIIPVCDGSNDGSAELLIEIGRRLPNVRPVIYEKNRGKGYAVRQGVLAAKGRAVIFTDSDLSTPLNEIERACKRLKDYHVVIGSRALEDSKILTPQGFLRKRMGQGFRMVTGILLPGIRDTQCGFKAFRQDVARCLFSEAQENGFVFDVEILLLARRHGFTIYEMPVTWSNNPDSSVRPLRDALRMLCGLIRIGSRDAWQQVCSVTETSARRREGHAKC